MRFATFKRGTSRYVGVVSSDGMTVAPLRLDSADAARGVLAVVAYAAEGRSLPTTGNAIALGAVALDAPIPRPVRNIFCVGKNYHEHAHEFARSGFDSSASFGAVPDAPIIFSKVPECVSAPGTAISIDERVSAAIDYEAELAVIIGRGGRGISAATAMDHVWGYTIVNDVTARDLQGRHSSG